VAPVRSRSRLRTSLARILAKALNCAHGPTADPDGTCHACLAIAAGTSLDVVEMDAASQRGIDDIREIRERVILQPVEGRYKVYILDEAHQLTDAAFNALLKLIEEPPPHCTVGIEESIVGGSTSSLNHSGYCLLEAGQREPG
jgi:DNA polymerase III subunit gamma/tau